MERPLISVIVPVYKVEDYLQTCVQSLQNQTYDNLEILLIDDGSPDNCPAMCDSYAARDSRIKVIHKPNGGLADARNAGLDHATGELIAFVDSDDWIAPETYAQMVQMLATDPALDIVCCAAVRVRAGQEAEQTFVYYPTGTVKSGEEITCRILLDEIGSQVVKGLYKRMCWEGVRFPLGRLYEDIPTTYQAFMKAEKVGFLQAPFYKYRANDESISNTPKAIKPYHIYLGFKSHYDCATVHFPQIAQRCCGKAAHYAISTYFHYCSERSPELETAAPEVRAFLDRHKQEILSNRGLRSSRAMALKLYYMSPGLFRLFCSSLHVLGLQKRLGFDMK